MLLNPVDQAESILGELRFALSLYVRVSTRNSDMRSLVDSNAARKFNERSRGGYDTQIPLCADA